MSSTLGKVWLVWAAPGSPGASLVASQLANELAGRGRICLVDLDLCSPSIAPMWALTSPTPGVAAACRLAGTGSLSATEFERLAVVGPDGERVLTGLGALEHWPELTAARVAALVTALREWNDVVIIDTGGLFDTRGESVEDPYLPTRSAPQRAAWQLADRVIAVGSADPIGLARLVRAWHASPDLPTPEHLVVNRLRAGALGMGPSAQVRAVCRQFIGRVPDLELPDDAASCDKVLLHAAPLSQVAPRSALRRALADWAHTLWESSSSSPP